MSKESVVNNYNREGEEYDRIRYGRTNGGRYFAQLEPKETLTELKPGNVLHVGTATGRIAAYLLARGYEYTGLEISKSMASITHARTGGDVARGDAECLPFRDGLFDNVVALRSFHFFPNPRTFMDEAFRVLKPGGRLTVSFERYISYRRLFEKTGLVPRSPMSRSYYRPSQVVSMILEKNFALVRSKMATHMPLLVYWNINSYTGAHILHALTPAPFGTVAVVVGEKPREEG